MQITSVVSLSLKVTLTAAFMILLVRSLLKLTADDTGSREYKANTFHFPSISVCPVAYENDGKVPAITLGAGKTFEDFRKLPSIRENVLADFTVMEPYSLDYSKYLQVSLNDEDQVQDLLKIEGRLSQTDRFFGFYRRIQRDLHPAPPYRGHPTQAYAQAHGGKIKHAHPSILLPLGLQSLALTQLNP